MIVRREKQTKLLKLPCQSHRNKAKIISQYVMRNVWKENAVYVLPVTSVKVNSTLCVTSFPKVIKSLFGKLDHKEQWTCAEV